MHHSRYLWLALLLSHLASAASLTDGPYVAPTAGDKWLARWVEGDESAPQVKQRELSLGQTLTVPAVGAVPKFKVRLRKFDPPASDEVSVSARTPLFIVADTHGQFEIFVRLLQQHGVIDKALRWSFRKGRLAILGDVFDRGPNHTEILWLIYKLEDEAARAGGGVHFVLGNHETMVLLGNLGYLNPKYPKVAQALQAPSYTSLWTGRTFLGQWLRTKAGVIKLGDYLGLHGGISRAMVDRKLTLSRANQALRNALINTQPYTGPNSRFSLNNLKLLDQDAAATDEGRERAGFVMLNKLGPLWYRGYFPVEAKEGGFPIATDEDVELARRFYGVKAILVGHTIVPTITPLYGGKVIAVQVYMRRDENSGQPIAEALRIENGKLLRAKVDGGTELLLPQATQ